jgi:hypothetical protein
MVKPHALQRLRKLKKHQSLVLRCKPDGFGVCEPAGADTIAEDNGVDKLKLFEYSNVYN